MWVLVDLFAVLVGLVTLVIGIVNGDQVTAAYGLALAAYGRAGLPRDD